MSDVSISIASNEAEKLLNKNITEPIRRAVFLVANFAETTAKKNLDDVIYKRRVPWKRTRKARQSITQAAVGQLARRVFMGVDYGRIIEEGSRPHIIRPKRGKLLAWKSAGKMFFARKVNHPGTKPYPFWKPMVNATQQEQPKIMKQEIDKFYKKV